MKNLIRQLAGIVEPNDCMCHLDEKGFYSHSLLQDYPSISQVYKISLCMGYSFTEYKFNYENIYLSFQINRKAREHNINIIFAIPPNMIKIYNSLSRSISGSSTGTLKDDSQNVVALVSSEYEVIH